MTEPMTEPTTEPAAGRPGDATAQTPDPPATSARRGRPGYDRARILEVAVGLFNEQGYDATSVADLALRLGLTKSALYHHFDSKEQLLAEALDDALSALEGVLPSPRRRPARPPSGSTSCCGRPSTCSSSDSPR